MDASAPKQFCSVDVANSRNHGLVHEKPTNRRTATADAVQSPTWIGVSAQDIWTNAIDQPIKFQTINILAYGRTTDVDDTRLADQPYTYGASRFRGRQFSSTNAPEQTQVDMQPDLIFEANNKMLAVSFNGLALATVQD
ncbi:MAG: hypothetical protein AAGD43_25775 [Pseudomonadota bacterium]